MDTSTSEIYTLSLHDALPISPAPCKIVLVIDVNLAHAHVARMRMRSEEHTSELQSRGHLVCRLLLEKKKKKYKSNFQYTKFFNKYVNWYNNDHIYNTRNNV